MSGTIKKEDNNYWIRIGKKWTNLGLKYKTYSTIEYKIIVTPTLTNIHIFNLDNKYIKSFKYTDIFIGVNNTKFSPYKEKFKGSSIVIEIKKCQYVYICDVIKKFKTTYPITKFYSIMGNNSIVYSYAITEDRIYLLSEMVWCKKEDWNPKIDPYVIYYNFNKKYNVTFKKIN